MPSLFCLQEDFFFLNIVCRKSPGKPVHIAAGGPLACLLFCPIFWQSAIKSMAHNNHYVVWGAVPAVLACAAGGQPHP